MAFFIFVGKPIALKIYKYYLVLKTRISKSSFFRSKLSWILYARQLINVVVVIIALVVANTNILFAKETKREDVAKKSNLYKIVQPDLDMSNEDIVEKANTNQPKKKNYVNTSGLAVATIPEITAKEEKNEVILKNQGSVLAATTVLENEVSKSRSKILGYEVQVGDTISSLATKFGVSVSTLNWANKLTKDSYIKPGQIITIPPTSGVLVKVADGDTLDKIIDKYKGDKALTMQYNNIGEDGLIPVGTEIVVANGVPYVPPPPPKPTSSGSSGSSGSWGSIFRPSSGSNVTGGKLNWPSSCRRISQGPRWGHIAIDINCGMNLPVYAAESGTATVIPNRGNGYGNYVIINHGNGLQTLYGHFSSFSIQNGAYVSRGQQIGWEGSTGWSTGPHVHFEVIQNGAKQNPWNYL